MQKNVQFLVSGLAKRSKLWDADSSTFDLCILNPMQGLRIYPLINMRVRPAFLTWGVKLTLRDKSASVRMNMGWLHPCADHFRFTDGRVGGHPKMGYPFWTNPVPPKHVAQA